MKILGETFLKSTSGKELGVKKIHPSQRGAKKKEACSKSNLETNIHSYF